MWVSLDTPVCNSRVFFPFWVKKKKKKKGELTSFVDWFDFSAGTVLTV